MRVDTNTRIFHPGGSNFKVGKTADDTAGRLASLSGILTGSKTHDYGSLVDGAGESTTVTVTGAALGDWCLATIDLDLQEMTMTAYVSAADTVEVRLQNESGSTVDLASTTLRVLVFKRA